MDLEERVATRDSGAITLEGPLGTQVTTPQKMVALPQLNMLENAGKPPFWTRKKSFQIFKITILRIKIYKICKHDL